MSTAAPATDTNSNLSWLRQSETLLSVVMLMGLVVVIVPLPSLLLDLLLATNLGVTMLLLMVTLSARKALELSVFPSLLLLMTLCRLSLNVATTRLILLNGDAGNIVTAFGNYVVGGNLVVGLVVFLILVTVQFMVITKGAGRISEVAARFTLDALPGKQMAIDSELQAKSIDDKEARTRREELARETEFYGAMDGAGKYVRGDAIAGLIITGVNLVGGVIIGMTDGLGFVESIRTYSILTVGDGLVSQIPALIIATTAGVLVTKTSSDDKLGDEIRVQMLRSDRPVWIGAVVLAVIALMPGIPRFPFFCVAGGLLLLLGRGQSEGDTAEKDDDATPPEDDGAPDDEQEIADFLVQDRATVEVGARLVPFIESGRTKGLSDRITALRRDFSQSAGIWIPPISVAGNLKLEPDEYRVMVAGRRVAGGELRAELMMAIFPEGRTVRIPGEDALEPAFQFPARWIEPRMQPVAEAQGCTVVDAFSVLLTHLGQLLSLHAHELLTREALKKMLDRVEEFAPAVIEDLKPDVVRMGTLHQVLVQLAEDQIPLQDLTLVLESVVNHGPEEKEADALTDRVRENLGRLVCERFRTDEGRLRVIALDPNLDIQLRRSLQNGQFNLQPDVLARLIDVMSHTWETSQTASQQTALLVDRALRRPLKQILARRCPRIGIISYQEVPNDLIIDPVTMIPLNHVFQELRPGDVGETRPPADQQAA